MSITLQINKKATTIYKSDISKFNLQTGGGVAANDSNNRKREPLIYALINRLIPEEWLLEEAWETIDRELHSYLDTHNPSENHTCDLLAGRHYNHDYNINCRPVEFKFNARSVVDLPQILSIASNKILFPINYSEFFYDNGFIGAISELYSIPVPERSPWLRHIHQTNYDKMQWFRDLKTNENIYMKEKKFLVDHSIHTYLDTVKESIDFEQITALLMPQTEKKFMLYQGGTFYNDMITTEECTVTSLNSIKKGRTGKYNTIVVNTLNERTTIHLLLRWKNHAGILMPGWQIKIVRT
jgi:hypothetical protein